MIHLNAVWVASRWSVSVLPRQFDARRFADQVDGLQRCGSNSPMRLTGVVGSCSIAPRAAANMSTIQSAKLNGHGPYAYLKGVLQRLLRRRVGASPLAVEVFSHVHLCRPHNIQASSRQKLPRPLAVQVGVWRLEPGRDEETRAPLHQAQHRLE